MKINMQLTLDKDSIDKANTLNNFSAFVEHSIKSYLDEYKKLGIDKRSPKGVNHMTRVVSVEYKTRETLKGLIASSFVRWAVENKFDEYKEQ